MAGKPIDMSKLRKTLKLHVQGKSKVFISNYLGISRNTVKKYLRVFEHLKLTFEELDQLSDAELESRFIKPVAPDENPRIKVLYAYFPLVEKKLKKTGETKTKLWLEYKEKHPDGVQRSQFCEHYMRWSRSVNAKLTMHIDHKAGDKMYVDYAGQTLEVIDPETGEVTDVQFFVAVLGASQYTYAEASYSQRKEDFAFSVENALHYFGGVPQAIVPDNLKAAVTKSDRYEPTLNEFFADFAEHYGTTVLPARAYRPKDKALVENAVKILYTRIYTILKEQKFFSLEELNKAILELVNKHNITNLTGRSFSRKQLFDELEKETLMPLAQDRYEIKKQALVTVLNNGHVMLSEDKHYYSVPYTYIRKKVKILYCKSTVEIFHQYNRIAVHKRIKSPHNYTTNTEHLASTHKFTTEWSADRFLRWAGSIDPSVELLISHLLNKKQHPEQSYKSCHGILSLSKKIGNERLTSVCSKALEYGTYSYGMVKPYWKKTLIFHEKKEVQVEIPQHNNIRGNNYYK
jgi:transposase